jgi:excisionase family DNA binding protein
MTMTEIEHTMTIEDVAAMLKVSTTTVTRMKRRGLPHVRIGSALRFARREVFDWVSSNQRASTTTSTTTPTTDKADGGG